MRRIGVDVGGTFTDLIYVDDASGDLHVHKLPTTVDDPSRASVEGILALSGKAETSPDELDQVFHGTTIATNIIIEHNGASVGLLTTEGYRDILHIARHKKPLNFSNYQDLPWQSFPIVRRRHRVTVPERVDAAGDVLIELDEAEARAAVRELKDAGVEAVAVCFLFSFLNPDHEQRVAEIVREEMPDVFLSVSSDVLPQYREYERFSTVALNAFVGPKVARYVDRLETQLRAEGVRTGVHLMTSGGGVTTAEGAIQRPVNLLMSGPVAGVVGGIWAGRQAGFENVITLDVGGTSADVGLAQSGNLRLRHLLDTQVGPYQAMIPMVDVDTIGAGGGSIAYSDAGGIFRVGPRSAGATPGPAAYGRGGTAPTVTDAMINLGWLPPESFLGGAMEVDPERARTAFEPLAAELGMTVEEASFGTVRIAGHTMQQAIEENSVRKGFDPRDFVLVAGGGAGPLFGALVAEESGIPAVVVPVHPGAIAALGLLSTDLAYEHVATVHQSFGGADLEALEAQFADLEARAREQLERDGIAADQRVFERAADCRYVGQGYELRVPCPPGPVDEAWLAELRARFDAAHHREYSRSFPESPVEMPNVRVRGIGLMEALSSPALASGDASADAARRRTDRAWFEVDGKLQHVPTGFYSREQLRAGNVVAGPAVVNQYDSTTVIPPGVAGRVDASGSMILEWPEA